MDGRVVPGYYWVRLGLLNEWSIAEYHSERWWPVGWIDAMVEAPEIIGPKIEPPPLEGPHMIQLTP